VGAGLLCLFCIELIINRIIAMKNGKKEELES